jgi:ketosteroid isomerase-like protein
MKIRFAIALAGLAIGFAPPVFAQQKDGVDAETAQQVRGLASSYDAAFNKQDAMTIAGLYAENAVFNTPEGTFHGRRAIEELYAKHYFGEAHSKNVVTVVNESIAAGNEVRATGTWSDTFEEPSTGTRRFYCAVLLRDRSASGDSEQCLAHNALRSERRSKDLGSKHG